MSNKRICDNIYCANCPTHTENYEHVVGIFCDRCEDAIEKEEKRNPICMICSEHKDDHDGPFPCENEDYPRPRPIFGDPNLGFE